VRDIIKTYYDKKNKRTEGQVTAENKDEKDKKDGKENSSRIVAAAAGVPVQPVLKPKKLEETPPPVPADARPER
jgi:hypothetical protein